MASILDIEDILSDETTQEIILKDWYYNEFLPKIDKDNIRNDYRLIYESFTINEFMHLPYDITDEKWNWLIKNQIIVTDKFNYENASNIEKWVYEEIRRKAKPIYRESIVKYAFSDKFFEDYQRNVIERRQLSTVEDWIYNVGKSPNKLYYMTYMGKRINNLKTYDWPRSYEPII